MAAEFEEISSGFGNEEAAVSGKEGDSSGSR